ncbi:hypothetical protein [Lysobacter silvisoli]|uniref:Uncharacterized protein n=1 Tax=Lysobacter silvisoli TaxID=2293254 RepID=A0A371JYH2_9GAMM|nr:hypothetical protein [Lysobacter silvisoli]RDZ26617.1 hypothetical protein DX914_16685 [Lysobacter silvisoli]
MRPAALALLPLAFALASPPAAAKGACLIQGELYGAKFKDCSEVDAARPDSDYKAQCESNIASIRSAGGSASATVSAACPSGAQGSCVNPMGRQVRTYYYARSTQELAVTRSSCESAGGSWRAP